MDILIFTSIYFLNINIKICMKDSVLHCVCIVFVLLANPTFSATATYQYGKEGQWGPVCTSGSRQSPINIIAADLLSCEQQKYNITFYSGSIVNTPDNTHALQNSNPGGVLRTYDTTHGLLMYDSVQYHWHYPSEHKINGNQYAMELHIVHSLNSLFSDTDTLAVTGILFQVDSTLQPTDTDIIQQFKATGTDNVNAYTILHNQLASKTFYHYLGSLTTPPCSQIVNWFVCTNIFKIKSTTLTNMQNAINTGMEAQGVKFPTGNARSIQSLNGRSVRVLDSNCNSGLSFSRILSLLKFQKIALFKIVLLLVSIFLVA